MNDNGSDVVPPGERNELEVSTVLIRKFLGITDSEFIELTAMVNGKPRIWQCSTFDEHVNGLRLAHSLPGFSGAYMLANGPVDPKLAARQDQSQWVWTKLRASDKDIGCRRAIFIDIDPKRPSGISSTEEEKQAAFEVSDAIRQELTGRFGRTPIGFGCSGNGYYLLIAVEPVPQPSEYTARYSRFLKTLGLRFGTDLVSVDGTAVNPARLMSCPGTWKCKGRNTDERPHRMTSFSCALSQSTGEPDRIPIGDLL